MRSMKIGTEGEWQYGLAFFVIFAEVFSEFAE
jgi:hypothetical protein